MKKRSILVSITIVVLIFVLSACGNQPGGAPPAGANGDDARPFAGTSIVLAGEAAGIFTEFYRSIISEFEELTGITVTFFEVAHEHTFERFLTEAMAGTGAIDVYQLDQPWISSFASMGFIEEVTDEIKATITDFSDFSESALGTMSFEGRLYGLPFQFHTPVLFYRTDLFEAAGLSGAPTTWEQLREYARILNDPDNNVFGTVVSSRPVPEPVTHLLDRMAWLIIALPLVQRRMCND